MESALVALDISQGLDHPSADQATQTAFTIRHPGSLVEMKPGFALKVSLGQSFQAY